MIDVFEQAKDSYLLTAYKSTFLPDSFVQGILQVSNERPVED